MPQRYITVGEVIDRLSERGISVTDQTVRRWAKAGKVRSTRLTAGGKRARFLFRVEDIDALLEDVAA